MNKIKIRCKYAGCLTVNSEEARGGLSLLWKENCSLTAKSYSKNHIDSEICWEGKTWRFTGIYGFPETTQKQKTWDLMCKLRGPKNEPWLLGGDFNEITNDMEKLGGPRRKRKYLEEFRKVIDECELRDMQPVGDPFSWYNTRGGEKVWERLDKFLCNSPFDSIIKRVKISNLEWLFSDHRPVEIEIIPEHRKQKRKQKKVFRFEEYWTKYEACSEMISNSGAGSGNVSNWQSLANNVNECSKVLYPWGQR